MSQTPDRQSNDFVYPEGLSEQTFLESIQGIVDSVDRDSLLTDEQIRYARTPVVQARLGKKTALDVDLHDSIQAIALAATPAVGHFDRSRVAHHARSRETKLLTHASNAKAMATALVELQRHAARLHELNGDAVFGILEGLMRQVLSMPNQAQILVLGHAEISQNLGGMSPVQIIEDLRRIEDVMVARVMERGDVEAEQAQEFIAQVRKEVAFACEWYQNVVAQSTAKPGTEV